MITSVATNAYDLLSEVSALVLAEPECCAMQVWFESDPVELVLRELSKPPCGCVGCIGGWVCFLTENDAEDNAREILGLTATQADELLYIENLVHAKNQQTPRHARAVARHIARFQAKYEDQLRATDVTKWRVK